jgi:hypothetical protein
MKKLLGLLLCLFPFVFSACEKDEEDNPLAARTIVDDVQGYWQTEIG